MTPELIELSKQAAGVLGVPAFYQPNVITRDIGRLATGKVWLAEDSGRCAEIAADKRISTDHTSNKKAVIAYWESENQQKQINIETFLADHNNDRKQAWRVAVLKAVIEQGKQS